MSATLRTGSSRLRSARIYEITVSPRPSGCGLRVSENLSHDRLFARLEKHHARRQHLAHLLEDRQPVQPASLANIDHQRRMRNFRGSLTRSANLVSVPAEDYRPSNIPGLQTFSGRTTYPSPTSRSAPPTHGLPHSQEISLLFCLLRLRVLLARALLRHTRHPSTGAPGECSLLAGVVALRAEIFHPV